jgi:hypothetical protein
MSSEDVLPSYAEATRMYETPMRMLKEEAMYITFKKPSSSSKIKSFILRTESDAQHDVYTGPKKKTRVVAFIGEMLTGECGEIQERVLQSRSCADLSLSSNTPAIFDSKAAENMRHSEMLSCRKTIIGP